MKTTIVFALALISAIGASGQTANLPETQRWMHAFAHVHSVWSVAKGNVYDIDSTDMIFKGCQATQILLTNGVSQGGKTYSLTDLDPQSITADSLGVNFETTNSRSAIAWVDEHGHRNGGALDSMWVINFDTEANAKRFATAFKRAVVLCGGKTSTF